MKTLVIGLPESLPPELADNPDVVVLDPSQLSDDMLASLDAETGGMLMGEDMPEGGEGALADWAKVEEREHGMGGFGDDEDPEHDGKGDDDDAEKDDERKAAGQGYGRGYGRGGRGDDDAEEKKRDGMGDDDDAEEKKGMGYGRGAKGGRGGSVPALSAWARAVGGRAR
jgi:hypothetical protein